MNINAERFFALTAMLAAPLVAAPACVITDNGNDDTGAGTDSASASTDPTATSSATVTATATDSAGTDSVGTTGADSSGGGTADATGDSTAGDTAGTTGGNTLGNCCEPDGSLGCEVAEVSDCVCASDPFCCDSGWDANCAQEVNSLGCGECVFPPAAYDCSCITDCDGVPVDTTWQVCGTAPDTAAVDGQAACEADLGVTCEVFSCDECSCFTAEIPEIECP